MSYFQAEKVLGGLPAQLTKSTLYCVKVGPGFDLYITDDNADPVAVKLNELPISEVEGAIDGWFAQSNLNKRLNALENDTSVIDIARIPAGALERLVTVNDAMALYALTAADVQVGDTVRLADTGVMYRVVDESKLDSAEGYVEYTTGRATAVNWAGVEDKPTTLEGYGILDGVKDTDPRLDDAREWTADTVTAEEAAAGLSDVPRKWTAERVKEAFNAYVRNILPASEALDAGDFVNIFDDAGVAKVRKADNSNGRAADGFVSTAVALAADATIQPLDGVNAAMSALSPGKEYWLGTAGDVTDTPLDETDPANVNKVSQQLGKALSATELRTGDYGYVIL